MPVHKPSWFASKYFINISYLSAVYNHFFKSILKNSFERSRPVALSENCSSANLVTCGDRISKDRTK